MGQHSYLAFDLGAESGRVMLATLANGRVSIEEIHRFPNGPVTVNGSLRWDVLRLFNELKTGVRQAAARGVKVASLSTDSWGVDYVWLKGDEPFLTAPFHYRDARTYDYTKYFKKIPAKAIFAETGIQFMHINTIYQLAADKKSRAWMFDDADSFLLIGDYFNYLFSDVARAEESLASTSQIYNPEKKAWSKSLIRKFGFKERVFPKIVKSGTVLGPVQSRLAAELGLNGVKVIATCSHDTGAAVAAVPAQGDGWAYLSSGTWSLVGIESPEPIINEASQRYNFTNEVGYGGSIRFLKNIIGLWILQECRRHWAKAGREYTYAQIAAMAEASPSLKSVINPNDERFGRPDDMPEKIAAFCRETKQPAPKTDGEYARCIYDSLALLYRRTLDQLEEITGRKLHTLHIVGGGSQSLLLNQLSANATGRTVIAGPVEATGIGNVLIQALALGHLDSLAALRQTVRKSFKIKTYQPQDAAMWQQAYERFVKMGLK